MNQDLSKNNDLNEELELELQRWLDGELDEAGEQLWLERCESNPALWRQVALMMLEQRLWDTHVGEVHRNEFVPEWFDNDHAPNPVVTGNLGSWGHTLSWVAACAATLLLGLVVGQQLSSNDAPSAASGRTQGGQVASRDDHPRDNEPVGPRVIPQEQLQLVLSGDDKGQPVNVPIQSDSVAARRQLLAPGGLFREDVMQALRRAGYRFQQQRQVIPVETPNGSWVVPVDRVQVVRSPYDGFQ